MILSGLALGGKPNVSPGHSAICKFSEEMLGFSALGRDQGTGFNVRVSIFVAPHDVDEAAELKMAVYTRS